MPIALVTHYEAGKYRAGGTTITLAPGQTLKIETTPGGEEILLETCPDGHMWTVGINVTIHEPLPQA
jgi:hypothetical protein